MNKLMAGFAVVDVTPKPGIYLSGYFKPRYAQGVLDPLQVRVLALSCEQTKVLLVSVDHLGLEAPTIAECCAQILKQTGIPNDHVFISSTHTHTGPGRDLAVDQVEPAVVKYERELACHVAAAAELALADLKPAKMGWGIATAPNIAFIRRFRMRDGSVMTNPGVDNPDIVAPIGDVDERVSVVRFDQEGGHSLVLVNFADHPDTVGGEMISADWPGFMRRSVEQALDNTKCIFFNGAQGDVNHVNVHPRGGYLNDMFMDFDDVARGYGHARYMGRVVAGAVMQIYDKVFYEDVECITSMQRTIHVPSQMPRPEELDAARQINALHVAGKDDEIPFAGMMLTTVVAEAIRMLRLEHGPETFAMPISGVAIGNVALVGIPGEPFSGIGRALKETEGWELVMPCCLTNAYEGYFPMRDSYEEGGYEARSSNFKAGVAELIIDEGKELLKQMKSEV